MNIHQIIDRLCEEDDQYTEHVYYEVAHNNARTYGPREIYTPDFLRAIWIHYYGDGVFWIDNLIRHSEKGNTPDLDSLKNYLDIQTTNKYQTIDLENEFSMRRAGSSFYCVGRDLARVQRAYDMFLQGIEGPA